MDYKTLKTDKTSLNVNDSIPIVTDYVTSDEDRRNLYYSIVKAYKSCVCSLDGQARVDKRCDAIRFHLMNLDTLLLFKDNKDCEPFSFADVFFSAIKSFAINIDSHTLNTGVYDGTELLKAYEDLAEALSYH